MGKPSKRRKSDGIQFNIGKRIKVQAQRKFAQGAAILPQQVPKDNPTTANNDNNAKNQSKKNDFVMPSAPKVYTEDFLTFLCFKGSQSRPSHLRVSSFMQPQAIYPPLPSNSLTSPYNCNSPMSQMMPPVQGFIPFGVRKQASQFPKKNISRKASMQAIKNQYNKQQQARFQTLTAKKSTSAMESRKKVLTKANSKVPITKTITKKKQNVVLTSNYSISTRRQSYQQKTVRKKFTPQPTNQTRTNVSLRNRIISITSSLKPDKNKLQETAKKKIVETAKSSKIPLKSTQDKQKNSYQSSKNTSTETNLSTSESVSPKSTVAKAKNTQNIDGESSQMCRTRSGTTRQQKVIPNGPKKVIALRSKGNLAPKTTVTPPKKSKIEGFEFSSDDDEPLYKKLSAQPVSESLSDDQSSKQESATHFTRSKLRDRESVENGQNKTPSIISKSPEIKTAAIGTASSGRITRQNITKGEVTLNKAIAKQTRSKSIINNLSNIRQSIDNAKNGIDADKISPKKTNTPVKRSNELKRLEYEHHPIQRKSLERLAYELEKVAEKDDAKIDLTDTTSLPEGSKKGEVKLEKSFSESDDEPLAAKIIETVKVDETKSKAKKGSKNETPNVKDTAGIANGGKKSNSKKDNAKVEVHPVGSKPVTSDTNPIPSYEESLKVFGIAHRYTDEKLSMMQSVKIKNCNPPRRLLLNKESNVERRHDFRGNYDISSLVARNDLKNRQSRKFMKPKEYIEQWLKDSARPYANRAIADATVNDPMSKMSKSITHVNLSVDSEDFMSQKPNVYHQDTPKFTMPNKDSATDNRCADMFNAIKLDENQTRDAPSKSTPLEVPIDDLNIYDFESESEMINSPPRKSKLIKEPHKRMDRCRSKFNTFKTMSYKALDNVQMNELSSPEMYGERIYDIDNRLESLGNVISKAMIVSLDPSQDTLTKESQSIMNTTSSEYDKRMYNLKNGLSDIYTEGYRGFIQPSFVDNLSMGKAYLPSYTANSQHKFGIQSGEQNKSYLPSQNHSLKMNSNAMDLLRTKMELISDVNTNCYVSTNNFGSKQMAYGGNSSNALDVDKNLFFLQCKKDYVTIPDNKSHPNNVRHVHTVHPNQIYNNVDGNDKRTNNNASISGGPKQPYQSQTDGSSSNDREINFENSDLIRSTAYSAQRSMLTDYEKRAYLTNNIPTAQINIPKYERPRRIYTAMNKVKIIQPIPKFPHGNVPIANVEPNLTMFDAANNQSSAAKETVNCNVKTVEVNPVTPYNNFQNDATPKTTDYYNNDANAAQPAVPYNNCQANTLYMPQIKANATVNYSTNNCDDVEMNAVAVNHNVNYLNSADLMPTLNDNLASGLFNNKTADGGVKLSSLQFGKKNPPGTDAISSISLKNFRLSSGMAAGSQQMQFVNLQAPVNNQMAVDNVQTSDTSKPTESENHLFYIPIHSTSKTGVDVSNHLIEGVAVKMDTQGPDGPQQRVIMRAKLVRKSQINKNVPKAMDKQTGPIMDMVRSVREAFPEATIHGDTLSKDTKGKKTTKSNAAANRKAAAASVKQKAIALPNPISSKSSTCSSQSSNSQALRRNRTKVETINHKNKTSFPKMEDAAQIVEAPIFQPTEKEFQDPLEFIEKISPIAARYGLCRIIPPSSFKSECKISDDMRFTPHNQYLHRMLYRWGSSSREMCAIKKYLATQSVTFKQPPNLCGIEVDLPNLYHIVQNMGGLNKVLERKMWHRVAEEMCLPMNVHYMDIRLDEIYCKYLLPYDTLSPDERKKLFESVDQEWEKRQDRMVTRAANPLNGIENEELDYDITEDVEECITRGKSITLCSYARTAKNTMAMQFGKTQQPTPNEVESKFWNYVTARNNHVCVSTGSIDSSVWGYGFPNAKSKNSPISKHPWNLKVLTNNSGSILRSLGPIMGVTVPTIHVGMLFSTCCWYRDPHGLPWIEYLHDGAPKIWYGVPDSQSVKFKETLTSIVPGYCQKKTVWLLSDTTMVPPKMLKEHGVSLCRTIQRPGEFILVFPKAFTSSICAGYNVSESVYFAPNSWLDTAQQDFIDIRNSCEPSMFSLERLIVAISEDVRTPYQVLKKVLPALNKIIQTEKQHREALFNIGLKVSERSQHVFIGKKKVAKQQDEVEECHRCRTSLSLSMLYNDSDGSVFCLLHAAEFLSADRTQIDKCKLVYMHSIDELERLLSKLIERINVLANKKCSKVK